jgi:histidinol phosphatase-like PHP family hydrolase
MRLNWIFFYILIYSTFASSSSAEELFPISAVMHIQSTVSDGKYSVDEIAKIAVSKGIDAVFLTDHDMRKWEYGLPPLRGLFKKKVEYDSVLKFGAARYLALVKEAERNNKGIIIIAGVESAPF